MIFPYRWGDVNLDLTVIAILRDAMNFIINSGTSIIESINFNFYHRITDHDMIEYKTSVKPISKHILPIIKNKDIL